MGANGSPHRGPYADPVETGPMEQVRRLLADLATDRAVADLLREDPATLAQTLNLRDELLEALRSAERFFIEERPVVDTIVVKADGHPHALNDHTDVPAGVTQTVALDTFEQRCGCEQSIAAIMASLASVAAKAIESIESIHHRHSDSDYTAQT